MAQGVLRPFFEACASFRGIKPLAEARGGHRAGLLRERLNPHRKVFRNGGMATFRRLGFCRSDFDLPRLEIHFGPVQFFQLSGAQSREKPNRNVRQNIVATCRQK